MKDIMSLLRPINQTVYNYRAVNYESNLTKYEQFTQYLLNN